MNIILTGFKACGKTTMGKALADVLNIPFYDTDTLVERQYATETGNKGTCRDIYRQEGDDAFRLREHAALESLYTIQNAAIATGGGIITLEQNRQAMQTLGCVVFIDTSLSLLTARLEAVSSPLFTEKSWHTLFTQRHPLYTAAAHIVFPVSDELPPHQLAQSLVQHLPGEIYGQ